MYTRLLFAFGIAFVLSACVNDGNTPRSFTTLAEAEERWKSYKFTQYTLVQRRSCFCIPLKYPLTLRIDSGGKVVAATDTDGKPVSTALGTSIEMMFDNIRTLQSRSGASVEVRYDSVYGYPRFLNADPIKQAADDEYLLETTLVR
jgi:hypothetical protein